MSRASRRLAAAAEERLAHALQEDVWEKGRVGELGADVRELRQRPHLACRTEGGAVLQEGKRTRACWVMCIGRWCLGSKLACDVVGDALRDAGEVASRVEVEPPASGNRRCGQEV